MEKAKVSDIVGYSLLDMLRSLEEILGGPMFPSRRSYGPPPEGNEPEEEPEEKEEKPEEESEEETPEDEEEEKEKEDEEGKKEENQGEFPEFVAMARPIQKEKTKPIGFKKMPGYPQKQFTVNYGHYTMSKEYRGLVSLKEDFRNLGIK